MSGIGPGETLLRETISGSSSAATNSLILEFGLGQATSCEVTVLWPSGRTDTDILVDPVNRAIRITEGASDDSAMVTTLY